jgi:beta-galactosidase/beta-glucuronidase
MYVATVFVNGKTVGFHRGGYFKFTFDLTGALKQPGEENELLLFVYDPTNSKDTLIPGRCHLNT